MSGCLTPREGVPYDAGTQWQHDEEGASSVVMTGRWASIPAVFDWLYSVLPEDARQGLEPWCFVNPRATLGFPAKDAETGTQLVNVTLEQSHDTECYRAQIGWVGGRWVRWDATFHEPCDDVPTFAIGKPRVTDGFRYEARHHSGRWRYSATTFGSIWDAICEAAVHVDPTVVVVTPKRTRRVDYSHPSVEGD